MYNILERLADNKENLVSEILFLSHLAMRLSFAYVTVSVETFFNNACWHRLAHQQTLLGDS